MSGSRAGWQPAGVNARLSWIVLLVCALAVLVPRAGGQALEPAEVPPPPTFGVRDASGVYQRDPETLRRMSDQLRQLREAHGFSIYVVVEPVLMSETPASLANRLQQAWLPAGDGIVVVYEADTGRLGLGRRFEDDPLRGDESPATVPAHHLVGLVSGALHAVDPEQPRDDYLEVLVAALTETFTEYFRDREAPPPPGRSLRLSLALVGGMAGLALVALAARWLVRRVDRTETVILRFPVVDRPERLGAPFGGGAVSSRRFGGNGDRRP